ncbi:MAG: apolipoprotein N-acyltransferase [Candidatus Ornithospirochaeta sp.]|nr:apolipoprotein N-acyltransferase [Candidatus Ornithospirochaeta sp.]
MKKILTVILRLFLILLSAFVTAMAFPNPFSEGGLGFLIFFSLIPMYYVIDSSSWKGIWLYGIIYGFVFYLIYNYWLSTFHPLAILIAPTLESVQYLFLFPVLKSAHSLFRKRGYIVQSIFHLSYLYLTQQGFLGYPYGNFSAALYAYPVLIQSASVFGIWLICLFIMIPQTLASEALSSGRRLADYKGDAAAIIILHIANALLGTAAFIYYDIKEPESEIRIAAVQHSADSWEGGYSTYRKNFETLSSLSLEAMEEEPDMVVWSETAFVPSVAWHTSYPSNPATSLLVKRFVDFGLNLPVPLVTGNPEGVLEDPSRPAILEDGTWNRKEYNTVIFFSDGRIMETYRKQHLVPFTEHFPYQKQFPKLTALLIANDYNWWESGDEATVFEYGDFRFSTPICFEDIFGYLSASFVRNGAEALINLTNDSWSGSVAAEMQHMQLASFRAIENRKPLLRSTNSGITCLVDPSGRIIDPMEPFTEGWRIYTVPLGKKEGHTFYTEHPDVLAKLSAIMTPVLLIAGCIHSVHRRRKEREESIYRHYMSLFDAIDDRYEC